MNDFPAKNNDEQDWYAVIYNDQGVCTGFVVTENDFKKDFLDNFDDEYVQKILNEAEKNSWNTCYYRSDRTIDYIKADSREDARKKLEKEHIFVSDETQHDNVQFSISPDEIPSKTMQRLRAENLTDNQIKSIIERADITAQQKQMLQTEFEKTKSLAASAATLNKVR